MEYAQLCPCRRTSASLGVRDTSLLPDLYTAVGKQYLQCINAECADRSVRELSGDDGQVIVGTWLTCSSCDVQPCG